MKQLICPHCHKVAANMFEIKVEEGMTDNQIVQQLVSDYFDCMVCTDHGKKLCELHAADERTEVYAQSPRMQEVYGCE